MLENICCYLENIFRRSLSERCIFVEVDFSAGNRAANLRHAVEDLMDANISTRKLCYGPTYIYYPLSTKCKPTTRIIFCWSLKAKVNNYCNWFPHQKTEWFQNLCSHSLIPLLRDSSTRWKMKIVFQFSISYLFPDIERHVFETVFLIYICLSTCFLRLLLDRSGG